VDGSTRVAKIFVNGSDRGVYVELQAKFPSGKNVWPAIWMVAERDGWPPEIDIWEHFGTFFVPDASWGKMIPAATGLIFRDSDTRYVRNGAALIK
jgi:hypothetical protein